MRFCCFCSIWTYSFFVLITVPFFCSFQSIGEAIVDKAIYFPLENESYSFSAEKLSVGDGGSKTQLGTWWHKAFSRFQKGSGIMCLQNNQWTHMIFVKLECHWHEARKLQFHDNQEDGYCEITHSETEHEYNVQEFWYTFHHGDEVVKMSFDDVVAKVEADQIRPFVSAGATLPAAWFDNQWERTSHLPHDLLDETNKMLSSFVNKFRESSAHVTVRQIIFTHCIGIHDPFTIS